MPGLSGRPLSRGRVCTQGRGGLESSLYGRLCASSLLPPDNAYVNSGVDPGDLRQFEALDRPDIDHDYRSEASGIR